MTYKYGSKAYQVQHRACQNTVYGEADAALHAEKAGKAIVLQYGLLKSTHVFCGGMAKKHVLLPGSIVSIGESVELWPVMHQDAEVMVAMNIGDEM